MCKTTNPPIFSGTVSDKHGNGGRFHQDLIMRMEKRQEGANMLADYCWTSSLLGLFSYKKTKDDLKRNVLDYFCK